MSSASYAVGSGGWGGDSDSNSRCHRDYARQPAPGPGATTRGHGRRWPPPAAAAESPRRANREAQHKIRGRSRRNISRRHSLCRPGIDPKQRTDEPATGFLRRPAPFKGSRGRERTATGGRSWSARQGPARQGIAEVIAEAQMRPKGPNRRGGLAATACNRRGSAWPGRRGVSPNRCGGARRGFVATACNRRGSSRVRQARPLNRRGSARPAGRPGLSESGGALPPGGEWP